MLAGNVKLELMLVSDGVRAMVEVEPSLKLSNIQQLPSESLPMR